MDHAFNRDEQGKLRPASTASGSVPGETGTAVEVTVPERIEFSKKGIRSPLLVIASVVFTRIYRFRTGGCSDEKI